MESPSHRHRNVFGGLDNAADQAESKHLQDLFIVDIDCHIFEPFASFSEYMLDKWRMEYNDARLLEESGRFREDYKVFVSNESEDELDPSKLRLLKAFRET